MVRFAKSEEEKGHLYIYQKSNMLSSRYCIQKKSYVECL